jgi:hypothetical protein
MDAAFVLWYLDLGRIWKGILGEVWGVGRSAFAREYAEFF